jgi:CRP/FNR family transcriptional regulator, cyclic AMP receptor protein
MSLIKFIIHTVNEKTTESTESTPGTYNHGRSLYKSYKEKAKGKRSLAEQAADFLTAQFGSFWFLILNIIVFTVWLLINTDRIPGIEPFDPYPFNFLTMSVSLEAIVLAIIVLMSQNRENKVNDLRSEIDTKIDIEAEQEISKALEILVKIARKQKIDLSKDEKLKKMLKPVDRYYLEKKFESEV